MDEDECDSCVILSESEILIFLVKIFANFRWVDRGRLAKSVGGERNAAREWGRGLLKPKTTESVTYKSAKNNNGKTISQEEI